MLTASSEDTILRQSNQLAPLVTAGTGRLSALLLALAVLVYPAPHVLAQEEDSLPMASLLFEPRAIPADDAPPDSTFIAVTSLVEESQLAQAAQAASTDATPVALTIEAAAQQEALRASIAEYVARIGDKEASEGPYSDELTQDLLATGQIYQQLDEHAEALNYFTRAQNISRSNHGIEDIDQAPVMEAMTVSHLALEQYTQADAVQDGLLYLYQKAYGEGSPEVAPALHRLGEWNLQAFLSRSNIMLNIKRINMQNFFGATGYNAARRIADVGAYTEPNNPTTTPLFKLYLAQVNFQNAINLMLQAKDYANPELLELERKLVTTLFLHTHQENIVYEPDFYLSRTNKATGTRLDTSAQNLLNSEDYDAGVESLRRSLTYIVNNEQRTPEQVAEAMLEAADWELLFVRSRRADEKYGEAYSFFIDNPEMTATITDRVYPEFPVVLPVFLPAPNSREKLGIAADEEVNYFGYFDVSFSITKSGKTRRVDFLGQGGEVTRNMEIRLGDYLKNLTFRPRFKEGELDTAPLRLRYYIGY